MRVASPSTCAAIWSAGPDQRDFPALVEFHAEGATDYYAAIYVFGENGDPAHGKGVVFSFTTDAPGGFSDFEIELIQSTLPVISLALKAHAGHQIASNLLRTYLGEHTAQRVHTGSILRGATEGLHAASALCRRQGLHEAHRCHARAPRSSRCSTTSSRR